MQDEENQRAETVRRMRSLLLLAAKKGSTKNETTKDRMKKETELFKKMFMACDRNNDGALDNLEVMGMARRHLKIAKRLVTDDQMQDFFNAIDEDGGGKIEFTEFLSFVRMKEENPRVKDIILTQVKRVVRLAVQKKKMTMAELEYRFAHAKEEGIITDGNTDQTLGPEEMRRFFRRVLDVSTHEAPDRNLAIAFKAMDEDGGGTLDADEFMSWMKQAINEQTTLCPHYEKQTDRIIPELLGGMAGALPERLPKGRPGTTFYGGASKAPFCFSGRDLDPQQRIHLQVPTCLKAGPRRMMFRTKSAMLEKDGLPKGAPPCTSPPMLRRCASTGNLSSAASDAPSGGGSAFFPQSSPSVCKVSAKDEESGRQRGLYTSVRGMVGKRDADMLNRIESRLFDVGVDVRGELRKHKHKHH